MLRWKCHELMRQAANQERRFVFMTFTSKNKTKNNRTGAITPPHTSNHPEKQLLTTEIPHLHFPLMNAHHVKTAHRRLSTTRAFPSPPNPAIRDKAREMEQMFHKWEWQRESWLPMVFLISPRRTTKERKGAATQPQHTEVTQYSANNSWGLF